jgi:hypothetical protein
MVIDTVYDGIGDAVIYAWLAHSATAAGLECRVNMRRHVEMGYIFGVTPDMTTFEPGDRYFIDRGNGSSQTADEVANVDAIGTRFRCWARHIGLGDIEPVRPPYIEHPAVGEWADKAWKDRDAETNSTSRVLIFPETYWESRQWPIAYFKDLAYLLKEAGHNVLTMLPTAKHKDGFPYSYYGMSLYHGAAMISRADLVIGPDSGPAHIAGTIGVPTLAICGPTRPEVVFGHMPSVHAITAPEVPCTGCHFKADKGFRNACGNGCQSLFRLTPDRVVHKVGELMGVEVGTA